MLEQARSPKNMVKETKTGFLSLTKYLVETEPQGSF